MDGPICGKCLLSIDQYGCGCDESNNEKNDDMKELMQAVLDRNTLDYEMLKSMSASLRADLPFSFNNNDMADLLDRLRSDHIDHMVVDT